MLKRSPRRPRIFRLPQKSAWISKATEIEIIEIQGPSTMAPIPMPTACPVVPPGSGILNIMMTNEKALKKERRGIQLGDQQIARGRKATTQNGAAPRCTRRRMSTGCPSHPGCDPGRGRPWKLQSVADHYRENDRETLMLDAFGRNQRVGKLLQWPCLAARHDHLQAVVVVIQVHMQRRNNQFAVVTAPGWLSDPCRLRL